MVDQRTVAAQFLDEDLIAQALRGAQIGLGRGKAKLEMAVVDLHGRRACVRAVRDARP